MTDLESILIKLNGKRFTVFTKNGTLTQKGQEVYNTLCSLLHDLQSIVPKLNAEDVEKELDLIIDL